MVYSDLCCFACFFLLIIVLLLSFLLRRIKLNIMLSKFSPCLSMLVEYERFMSLFVVIAATDVTTDFYTVRRGSTKAGKYIKKEQGLPNEKLLFCNRFVSDFKF